MSKKKTRNSKSSKKPAVRRKKAVPPGKGPVTLKQAQALARAQQPVSTAKSAVAQPNPASVGVERKKLERRQDQEFKRRIREYKATLAIMKERGVKGLGPAPKRGEPAPKSRPKPLQILAEGDSWFDYPVPFFGGGIVPRLENKLGVPVLNLAKAGDEVRFMLGVKERKLLIDHLRRGCPAGGAWDVLLFSGGGNDIVHHPMALWIRDFDPTRPPGKQLYQERFDAVMTLVRAGYEDLITLRNTLSPVTHIVLHTYDFAIPDGRGICHLGPWMKPAFDLRGFPDRASAFEVVKVLLRSFSRLLHDLAERHAGVSVLDTQGTLREETASWHNELHPRSAGFNAFAGMFRAKLKELFPTRLP